MRWEGGKDKKEKTTKGKEKWEKIGGGVKGEKTKRQW